MSSADAYKRQQILTATPEHLILLLYNGCIQFINEAKKCIEGNDLEGAHNACVKAQNIIIELHVCLNREMPITDELVLLYEYAQNEVALANFKKDTKHLEVARVIISNIREGWMEAIKIAREQGALPDGQKVVGDSSISI